MSLLSRLLGLERAEVAPITRQEINRVASNLDKLGESIKGQQRTNFNKITIPFTDLLNDFTQYERVSKGRELLGKKRDKAYVETKSLNTAKAEEVETVTQLKKTYRELESSLRIKIMTLGVRLEDLQKVEPELAQEVRETLTPIFVKLGYQVKLPQRNIEAMITKV